MEIPLEIAFKGIDSSDPVQDRIRQEASQLNRYRGRVTSIRVTIEKPHHEHHRKAPFDVRIHLGLRGPQAVDVSHEPGNFQNHQDPLIAIRDAFAAALKQLEHILQKQTQKMRWLRDVSPFGRVTKLFPEDGYGFIEIEDGTEVYFSRRGVLKPGYDWLTIGTEVRFNVRMSEFGPYASSILAVGEQQLH